MWGTTTKETWIWRGKVVPQICKEAQAMNADLYFIESTEISYENNTEDIRISKDELINSKPSGLLLNMTIGLGPNGNFLLKYSRGELKADVFLDFLIQILRWSENPILLVVENSEIYKSKLISEFIEAQKSRIKLFYTSVAMQ